MVSPNGAIILMLVVILLIGGAILAVIALSKKDKPKDLNKAYYQAEWQKIDKTLSVGDQASYQMAILNADKLLSKAMKEAGIPGKNTGEQLKAAEGRFTDLDAIWRAHKNRNRIAHEVNANITKRTVATTMMTYKNALKELRAL